ncbi:MAG: right-handed parallel beta-helix repeat-containing protein [Candidatus Omnitrophica bacterium]|nr:right-handed parallel beta-helix repeat-containing protein [Candidatus Omnitrophota bacterium]
MDKCLRKKGIVAAFFAFLMTFFLGICPASSAATLTVDDSGGADYTTIQDAIDNAGDSDTILVSPGTYNEQLMIDVDELTIQSTDGAATTIINCPTTVAPGGITFDTSGTTFDGFTVQDFSDTSSESKIFRVGLPPNTADQNLIKNCVIQGNLNQGGVTYQTDYGILVYGSDNQITDNEIFDMGYMGINVVGTPHSEAANNIISGNNIHNIGIYAIGVDRSPNNNVIITENQISNLVGGDLWGYYYDPNLYCYAIVAWGASAEGTVISGHNLSGIPNGIVLSSACGVYVLENTITADNVGLRISWTSWVGDIPDNNVIAGNTITGCGTGVVISPGAGSIGTDNFLGFNNIYGNTIGADNLGTEIFTAEKNWWGDASGPYHSDTNPGGLGNEVSDYIDYEPWFGAEITDLIIIDSENPYEENGDAGIAVDVAFDGGTEGIVIVAAFGENNPTEDDDFEGNFFDVFIPELSDIEEVIVRLYYNELSAKTAYWHNVDEWIVCSDQEVVEGTVVLEGVIYDGYVEVTINDGTSPSLADLTGTIMALRDTPLYDDVSGQSKCFIATAAFGSPFERHVQVLREFRDKYLLTNPAGQAFVRWYYSHSPKYAAVIAQNPVLKTAVRVALMPFFAAAFLAVKGFLPYLLLGAGLFLLSLIGRARKAALTILAAGLLFGFSAGSYAADGNHFDVSPGENYSVTVPTTHTIGHFNWEMDIFYSYANKALEAELAGTEMDLVKNQHLLQATLTFGICNLQQISLVVPYIADQLSEVGGTGKSGMGDLSLIYKFRFPTQNENGFKVAVAPYLQLDTGKDGIYMNAGDYAVGIRGIVDKRLNENLLWTGNIGYAYQPKEELGNNIEIEHTLLFGMGMVFNIPKTCSYISAELFGRSEDMFDTENTPVEGIISYGFAKEHTTFTIGAGLGVVDGYGAPDWRLFTGLRFGI